MAGDEFAAMAGAQERLARRVAELESMFARLTEQIRPGGPERDAASRVRSWLLVDNDETARGDLDDLTEWLDAVYLRYPGTSLPGCWQRHPHVVEELLTLRWLHHEAYRGRQASWQRVADWHERYRPGVVHRLSEALRSCELSLHVPGGKEGRPSPTAPLRSSNHEIASTWATERRVKPPTPGELAEADQYEAQANSTHH